MSTLTLPLRKRRDVELFHFPAEVDADAMAAEIVSRMKAECACGQCSPRRVVPLTDRAAYIEAVGIFIELMHTHVEGCWIRDQDRAEVAFNVKQADGSVAERLMTIRIIQILRN